MQRCPTPVPWLLYIFLDRGQDLERARSSAALNLRRVVHVFSADGPWATGRGLLRADFCRSALFFCVEGAQGCHCFSWELSLACRAPGMRAKCMHSKVLKICTNVVLVLVRGSTRLLLTWLGWSGWQSPKVVSGFFNLGHIDSLGHNGVQLKVIKCTRVVPSSTFAA